MSSNLTPVPITDKNGKRTTVHRKVQAVPSASKADFPAPKRDPYMSEGRKQKLAERAELRKKVYDVIVDPDTTGPNGPDKLSRELSLVNMGDQLQRILAVAEAINESGQPDHQKGYEKWKLAESLRSQERVNIAYNHLELIRASTQMSTGYGQIVYMHEELVQDRSTNDDPEPVISNLESHLYAYNMLKPHLFYGESTHVHHYINKFSRLTDKYPDKVERLCSYLIDRGGLSGFNEDAFHEHLNTYSSLAEGTL